MGHFDRRNIQYYRNYASLKARGVGGLMDKVYTMTIHKCNVRVSGYEYYSDLELERKRLVRKLNQFNSLDSNDLSSERFANSIVRSRSAVIQLGANNPWEYFVTLTLSRDNPNFDAYDLSSVKKKLLNFFSLYSRRSGKDYGFKYLLIPEKHKDGAWHFHGFLMGINPKDLFVNNNGYLDFMPFRERFGWVSFGRTKSDNDTALGDGLTAGRIRDLPRAATYISKYISKDMFGDEGRPGSEHLYFASKGLKRDETIIVGESAVSISELVSSGYEVIQNEFCAKIPVDMRVGISFIKPFMDSGVRDRFNLPSMPLKLSKKKRDEYLTRRRFEISKVDELASNVPTVISVDLSPDEVFAMERLFSRVERRHVRYEQLNISDLVGG